MVRTPSFDKNGIKKGAWSPEEDRKLQACIHNYGIKNWRELPRLAGLKRCGKSCRLRWMNYLRPNVKRGNYTKEEEDLIIQLHHKHGNKWALMASKLPGRTDNEIKNHWHTHLKKCRMTQNASTTSSDKSTQRSTSSSSQQKHLSSSDASSSSHDISTTLPQDCFQHIQILESCPFSPQLSSSPSINHGGFKETVMTSPDLFADFTSMTPFNPQTTNISGELVGEATSMLDVFGDLEDEDFWTTPFSVEDMISYSGFIHKSTRDSNNELSSYVFDNDESIVDLFCGQIMQDAQRMM